MINKKESTITVIGVERGGILDRRSMINASMTTIEIAKRLRKQNRDLHIAGRVPGCLIFGESSI